MAYRADFYIPENIIGYTGRIDSNPTVYFKTGPPQGPNEYGHITQAHKIGPNEGREAVRRSANYQIRVGATGELEEFGCSIARFTEKKHIDRFSEQQIDELYDHGRVLGR